MKRSAANLLARNSNLDFYLFAPRGLNSSQSQSQELSGRDVVLEDVLSDNWSARGSRPVQSGGPVNVCAEYLWWPSAIATITGLASILQIVK